MKPVKELRDTTLLLLALPPIDVMVRVAEVSVADLLKVDEADFSVTVGACCHDFLLVLGRCSREAHRRFGRLFGPQSLRLILPQPMLSLCEVVGR